MIVHFFGATRTTTGSMYLLEINGQRLLLECGLFQGLRDLRERNWQGFPVPAASIRRAPSVSPRRSFSFSSVSIHSGR